MNRVHTLIRSGTNYYTIIASRMQEHYQSITRIVCLLYALTFRLISVNKKKIENEIDNERNE